jgi:prephenate dehydrogenase
MSRYNTVAIIGVGLIGGSIGLALRSRDLAGRVVGIGRSAGSLRQAARCGAVTETTTRLARGVADAELIVVCTPVQSIVDHVLQAAESCPQGALITDAGSTKASIVAAIERELKPTPGRNVAFIGSHPLAGSEKTGVQFARADLLEGRVVVVTPTRRSRADDVVRVEQFWGSLGTQVLRKTPQAHDQAVAATSHLPHVLASLLAAATPRELLPLVAGGWLDTTRVAAGDVELWRQILNENRADVLKSLDKFAKVLASFRAALQRGDQAKIAKLLEAGKQNRDAVGS